MIANRRTKAIVFLMNNRQRKTLAALLADPGNGNLEGSKIETLLLALGCRLIEGPGPAVTFVYRRLDPRRPQIHCQQSAFIHQTEEVSGKSH